MNFGASLKSPQEHAVVLREGRGEGKQSDPTGSLERSTVSGTDPPASSVRLCLPLSIRAESSRKNQESACQFRRFPAMAPATGRPLRSSHESTVEDGHESSHWCASVRHRLFLASPPPGGASPPGPRPPRNPPPR